MFLITVFTTTYNRVNLLPRVYASLCQQTINQFEWLIVDDGSVDGTKAAVEQWIKEDKLTIRYIYKENGGVHTARNIAYREIKTELCFQVDSDDWLLNDAVETVLSVWKSEGGRNFSGIVGLCTDTTGELIGSRLPDRVSVPFRQLNTKYKVTGDKCYAFRTEVMVTIPDYPVFHGENRVPIAWKYSQIPDNMEILIINRPLCVVEYQPEGISAGIRKQYFRNPKGMAAGYEMVLRHAYGIKQLVKSSIGYTTFSLMSKNGGFISKSPRPLSTLVFLPLGLAGYIYINAKWGKYRRLSNTNP